MDEQYEEDIEIHETNLYRLYLCATALKEIKSTIVSPEDADDKADLILVAEDVLNKAIELYQAAYKAVWNEEYNPGSIKER
jgi:hypothetical protein